MNDPASRSTLVRNLHGNRLRTLWLDVAIAVLIGLGAAGVAFRYVAARYTPPATDTDATRFVRGAAEYYLEDVLSPCVHRFGFQPEGVSAAQLPEWQAFVTRRIDAFPCKALRNVPIVPVDYFSTLHTHLHRAMSIVFAAVGPRLIGFAYFEAIQYGLFIALLYGIFRLGMGRVLSAILILPMMLSPRHLEIAAQPLEYAKAPAFAACVLGVALLVCYRMSTRAALALAFATGCAVGIGFGFKTDVLVFAPFGAIALVLFFRAPRGWRTHVPVVALYVVGVLLAGAPLIRAHFFGPQRSLVPVQILGGMAPGFAAEYAEPGLYDYGLLFDDQYLIAEINSYNQRVNGSTEFGPFYSKPMQAGAFGLVMRLQRTFVADILLRTGADVLQILRGAPGGLIAALLVVLGLAYFDRRRALFLVFALAYMVGYVSLVFSPKHYFHLEFVPWVFIGCVLQYAASTIWRLTRRSPASDATPQRETSWVAAGIAIASSIALVAGTLGLARIYQDRQVRKLFDGYMNPQHAERLALAVESTPTSGRLAVPAQVSIDGHADASATLVTTDYLKLHVMCGGTRSGEVTAVYRLPRHWRHALTVPCERAGQRWTLMWPVYQRKDDAVFLGFEYPDAGILRVDDISRMRDVETYTMLPRVWLPDDWQQRPLHHVLKSEVYSLTRVRSRPAAFPPQPLPLPPPAVSWSPPFTPVSERLSTQAPDLTTWNIMDGVTVSRTAAGVAVHGNNSPFGYQVMSRPIDVPPHSTFVVRVHGVVERGRVGVGILDGSQQHWLKPPQADRSDFSADTGADNRVLIVFANVRQPADGDIATQFAVQSVSFEVRNRLVDRIAAWLWPEH